MLFIDFWNKKYMVYDIYIYKEFNKKKLEVVLWLYGVIYSGGEEWYNRLRFFLMLKLNGLVSIVVKKCIW